MEDIKELVKDLEEENNKTAAADPGIKTSLAVVEDFLKHHPVLCYGGTAINNLLPKKDRFYDPTVGRVLVDGIDLRAAEPAALRARVALVSQEPVVFGASIAENIAYGRPDAPREAIVDAARRAAAHDFISALPAGYDTRVGERGIVGKRVGCRVGERDAVGRRVEERDAVGHRVGERGVVGRRVGERDVVG